MGCSETADTVGGENLMMAAAKFVEKQSPRQHISIACLKKSLTRVIPKNSTNKPVGREDIIYETILNIQLKQITVPNFVAVSKNL